MIKRVLSYILAISMMSVFLSVNVNAASPIVFDGTTQVVFERNFGGYTSVADITDFTITGEDWQCEDYFIIGNGGWRTVETNSSYDVSDAAGYTFQTKVSNTYGEYQIHLAYANNSGYILIYDNTSKQLKLYKDSTASTALASMDMSSYGADNTITAQYTKETNTLEVTNSVNANILKYTPQDNAVPNLNGKFRVTGGYAGLFTLFSMKLEKNYDNKTVNTWRYEKTFTSDKDTISSLAAEGITFSSADAVVNTDSVTYNQSGASSHVYIKPNNRDLSADYAFELKTSKSGQSHIIKFNYINDDNYYSLQAFRNYSDEGSDKGIIRLKKYIDGEVTELYSSSYGDLNITGSNDITYKVTMKKSGTAVSISTTVTNHSNQDATFSFNTIDSNPFVDGGAIAIHGNYTGESKLYYVNAWSVVSEGESTETVTYSENVMNKTFSGSDTISSLNAEGISFGSNDYVTINSDSVTYNVSGSNNHVYIKPQNNNLSGDYNFEVRTDKTGQSHIIKFNWIDKENYYALQAFRYYGDPEGEMGRVKLIKYETGKSPAVLYDKMYGDVNIGNTADITYKVSVKNTDSGVKIAATVINHTNSNESYSLEAIDTSAFSKPGCIAVNGYYTGASKLYYVKVFKNYTEMFGSAERFKGVFYKDAGNNAINEMIKGTIYFSFPIAMLGEYSVVAVLYEDNKMTGIKFFEPIDLYGAPVQLFDTSGSSALDVKIRVYFVDGTDTLNILSDVYELD